MERFKNSKDDKVFFNYTYREGVLVYYRQGPMFFLPGITDVPDIDSLPHFPGERRPLDGPGLFVKTPSAYCRTWVIYDWIQARDWIREEIERMKAETEEFRLALEEAEEQGNETTVPPPQPRFLGFRTCNCHEALNSSVRYWLGIPNQVHSDWVHIGTKKRGLCPPLHPSEINMFPEIPPVSVVIDEQPAEDMAPAGASAAANKGHIEALTEYMGKIGLPELAPKSIPGGRITEDFLRDLRVHCLKVRWEDVDWEVYYSEEHFTWNRCNTLEEGKSPVLCLKGETPSVHMFRECPH